MSTAFESQLSVELWPATAEAVVPTGTPAASAVLSTPGQAESAAAKMAPRLFAQAAETDVVGAFPSKEFDWMRKAGLLTATLPAAMGGAGLQDPAATLALLRVLQHIGQGNLAVGRIYEGHLNALLLIQQLGTPAQVKRYAADARAGLLFGVWNTEDPAEGVRLEALANGRYRLRGAKTFASGAGHLQRPLISGALPDGQGWQLFVLPTDQQPPELDRSFWRPLGMRATASFRADLTDLEIGSEDLIGAPNSYYRQPGFSGGAIRFAAVQLGGAAAVFEETHAFLRVLGRTDDPYQRQRLGEMAIALESGQQWLRGAAEHAARPDATTPEAAEATVAYANMTRTAIETICLTMLQLAERSVGARGLLQPLPFERLHRDLTHYLRQPAPDGSLADVGRFVLEGKSFVS
ncbi:acyl-CoA dehydrogenase family protein [Hymenobacter arizonensis]|uniref:Acyl-CoA dehydrogenase n=1 Tax=Hymenobacter arizonensis TaxID=1227077 RepID=A0A1I5ZL27_HYMAR|nr:acyl-CoA dehydrogenase family protein [Hymenobacter arizonensis]SFQ57196.1 Acyl-CoA dehydrogenase [Hymenobacter arizonensis]